MKPIWRCLVRIFERLIGRSKGEIRKTFSLLAPKSFLTFFGLSGGPVAGKEYAKADTRWAVYDPTVLSLELLTVLLAGPLAILLVWTILNNNKWRHPLQIIISVCELYGGWMTFGPGTALFYAETQFTRLQITFSDFSISQIYRVG